MSILRTMNFPDSDDLLDLLAAAYRQKQEADHEIESIKSQLAAMRADGFIGDQLSSPSLSLSWVTRSSWQYSPAIKQAQDLEKLEGTATKRESSSWTIKPVKTATADF